MKLGPDWGRIITIVTNDIFYEVIHTENVLKVHLSVRDKLCYLWLQVYLLISKFSFCDPTMFFYKASAYVSL